MSDTPNVWHRHGMKAGTTDQLGSDIAAHVTYLDDRLSADRRRDEIHGVMYANRASLIGTAARVLELMKSRGNSPLKLNITRSMIETVTARIAMDFPLVQVAADGAEWSYKLKARKMTRFITGKQEETGFRRISPLAFRECCVVGTGPVKVTSEGGDIVHELAPKGELYVDPVEGRYGEIRNIHQRKQYARDVLIAKFPKKQQEIAMAPPAEERDTDRGGERFDRTNLVDVFESIHLPSGPGEEDGLRVISLANGRVLYREEWKRPRLPYAFLHWSPPRPGSFWGTGLAEELAPIQWSIDRTVQVLDEGFRVGAPLRVFVQRNAKIISTQLIPHVGTLIETSGAKPEFQAPSNPVSQQQISWLLQLIEQAYTIAGISLMAAAAKKPGGIESAVGLQTYHDFETERFQHVEGNYQNLALDCAELAIDEAKDIYGAKTKDGEPLHRKFASRWVHRDVIETIPWADVDLERDCFKLKLKPVNFLTGTVTGKLERAQALAQSGLVSPEWILPLFDNPDIQRFVRLETATFNYCEWFVEKLMDDGADMPQPDSMADLKVLEKHIKAGHLDCKVDGAPEQVLKRFREAATTVSAKQKKATSAAAAAMPPAPGMPPGMPPGGPLPPAPAPTTMPGQALPGAPAAMAA